MARTTLGSYGSAYAPDEDEEEKRARALETFQEYRQPLEPDLPMGAFPSQAEATEAAKPAPLGAGYVAPEREIAPAGHNGESTGGWDEGTKDAALATLAGFLDLAMNKGRGVGSILQASNQQASQRTRAKERGKKDAQDYQLQAQRMVADRSNSERRFEGDEKDRSLRTSQQELERQQALERHQRFLQLNDPNSEANRLDLDHKRALTDEARARASRDPNAITPYQQMQLDAQAAERGERGKDRDEDRDWRKEQSAAVREATQLQRDTANEAKATAAYQGQLDKFREKTERSRPQLTRAMEMEQLVKDNPGDLPGVGEWDSRKGDIPLIGKYLQSPGDVAMRGNLNDMADLILRERSGAAAPPVEVVKLAENIAAGGGATEDQFRVLQGEYNKLLKGGLQQQAVGRDKAAREVLGERASWALGDPAEQQPLDITDQLGQPGAVNDPRLAPQQQQLMAAEEEDAEPMAAPAPIRLGKGRTPRSINPALPGGTDGSELMPPGVTNSNVDVLPTTGQSRGQVTNVSDHLRRLQEEDDDLGVSYR